MKEQTQFKTGDVFLKRGGGGYSSDLGCFTSFVLFEYREEGRHGEGFTYDIAGKAWPYYWAYPNSDDLFQDMPEDVLYSFQHGSRCMDIPDVLLHDGMSKEDIIRASTFKVLTPEQVVPLLTVHGVATVDDVREHWELIKKHGVTPNIAEICFRAAGADIRPPYNGETGLHAAGLLEAFMAYLPYLSEKLGLPTTKVE